MKKSHLTLKLITLAGLLAMMTAPQTIQARTFSNEPVLKKKQQIVKVDGDHLYIGTKYDEHHDLLITFSPCMFNHLMTFSQVGLSKNDHALPLDNPDRKIDIMLNQAFSDNIGPFGIHGHGWCGANHSYLDQNQVRTAQNISYTFYADGRKLSSQETCTAKCVKIQVENQIFDPTYPPVAGTNRLTEELCRENVTYQIEEGCILVKVHHHFTNTRPVPIYVYYGMQSMFWNEDEIMTPQGAYKDFTDAKPNKTFYKGDFPAFRRIIERRMDIDTKEEGKYLYQSTYLLPEKEGKHKRLGNQHRIFTHSWGKCYHVLYEDISAKAGLETEWKGLYSWPVPLVDNEDILSYTARANGKDYLFIDAKHAITNFEIVFPSKLQGKRGHFIEKTGKITQTHKKGKSSHVNISSTGPASWVVIF